MGITPIMRTLDSAHKQLIAWDPQTSISKRFIRQAYLTGAIPHMKIGNRVLINMEDLTEYIKCSITTTSNEEIED